MRTPIRVARSVPNYEGTQPVMSNKPLPLDATHLHDVSDPNCENHRAARTNGQPTRPGRTCPHCYFYNHGEYRMRLVTAETVGLGLSSRGNSRSKTVAAQPKKSRR